MNQLMNARLTFRTRDQVTAYFAGMELVDPGVVRVPDWRPDDEAARKPL
nr:SAM-dependent methyltransferase [Actinoplanes globisporus]